MPTPAPINPKVNPLAYNALQGVAAELQSKVPLALAAEAERIGGIVAGNQLFKTRAEYDAYVADLDAKAKAGDYNAAVMLQQLPGLTADFSQLGNQEGRIAEDARLAGLSLTEGQKLARQADLQRLLDLGGNADGGLAKGYNDLNLLLQADSMRSGAALADELNPEQAAIRKKLGSDIFSDLNLGNTLNADESRWISQGVRNAQAARGNLLGTGSLLQEANSLATAGDAKRDQRMGRGFAFLEGGTQPILGMGTTTAQGSDLEETLIGDSQTGNFGSLNSNAGWMGVQATPVAQKKKKSGFGSLLGTVAGGFLGAVTGGVGTAAGAAIGGSLFGGGGGDSQPVGQASGGFWYPQTNNF